MTMTTQQVVALARAARARLDPGSVPHGPAVLTGSGGRDSVWLYADGIRQAVYQSVWLIPESEADRLKWVAEHLRLRLAEFTSAIAHLEAALTGPALGYGVAPFRWPMPPDWRAELFGPTHLDAAGRPDGAAALAHLRKLEAETRQQLAALEGRPQPGQPLEGPALAALRRMQAAEQQRRQG
jgi:hypothetical protein